jgi:hypothetical protein
VNKYSTIVANQMPRRKEKQAKRNWFNSRDYFWNPILFRSQALFHQHRPMIIMTIKSRYGRLDEIAILCCHCRSFNKPLVFLSQRVSQCFTLIGLLTLTKKTSVSQLSNPKTPGPMRSSDSKIVEQKN